MTVAFEISCPFEGDNFTFLRLDSWLSWLDSPIMSMLPLVLAPPKDPEMPTVWVCVKHP